MSKNVCVCFSEEDLFVERRMGDGVNRRKVYVTLCSSRPPVDQQDVASESDLNCIIYAILPYMYYTYREANKRLVFSFD